jgi:hypothetical protein
MNPTPTLRRAASTLAAIATAVLAALAAAPAALAATTPRPARPAPADSPPLNLPGVAGAWNKHPPLPAHAHAIISGGMPGWQITLIAAAALLAAALAVTGYRILTARRRVTPSAA